MNFFDAKFIHIALVVIYVYSLMTSSYNPDKKIPKIILGIFSLFLLGSGFILLGKLGIPHSGPFPVWVWVKFGVWFSLSILPPIFIKRFPNKAKRLNLIFIALVIAAAFMGIYKPN